MPCILLSRCFQYFTFESFSSLIMMCLLLVHFIFILLRVCWISQICRLMTFINLGFFLVPFSLCPFSKTPITCIIDLLRYVFPLFFSFFLCFTLISIDLSLSSLVHSYVWYILWAYNPIDESFILVIIIPFLGLPFGSLW